MISSSSLASPGSARATTATRFARIGLWLIPLYGALLAASTLTHQPDYETDFQSYAEYITTDRFLVSHLGASIAGARRLVCSASSPRLPSSYAARQ